MTKITNDFGVPDEYVRLAVLEQRESRCDFPVTTLIDAPQVYRLKKQFPEENVSDISDMIAAMVGSGIHHVFEKAAAMVPNRIVEERVEATIFGKTVGGRIDKIIEHEDGSVELRDLKAVKAASLGYSDGPKVEWVKQLNLYAALKRRLGSRVTGLSVEAIVKDWSRFQARLSSDYPRSPVVIIDVPMWDADTADAYLVERVRVHMQEDPPPCTEEEYWGRPEKWAVHEILANTKKLKARATRVFSTLLEADSYIHDRNLRAVVQRRPGRRMRCEENYCGVAGVCRQYALAMDKADGMDIDGE